jgi:hypothetical protein
MRVERAAGHFRPSTPKQQGRSDENVRGFDFKVAGCNKRQIATWNRGGTNR